MHQDLVQSSNLCYASHNSLEAWSFWVVYCECP